MLSHLVITSSAKTWIRRTVIKISGCSTQKINRLLSSILQKIYLSNSFFRIKVFRAMKIRGKCRIGRVNMKAEKMNETSISSFLYMKNSFFFLFPAWFKVFSINWGYSSCSTWYIPNFLQDLAHWSSSHKSSGISGRVFGFILSYFINWHLRVVLDRKSLQEYPVDAGVLLSFNRGPRLSERPSWCCLLLLSMLMVLLSTLNKIWGLICGNN